MRTIVITPPVAAVTLERARTQLRIDALTGDQYLQDLISVAQGTIDGPAGWLGRAVGPQVLETRFDGFDACSLSLPYPPLISIVSFSYFDQTGALQSLAPAAYDVFGSDLAPIWNTMWPSARWGAETVRVQYKAGYVADPNAAQMVANAPAPIQQAILLLAEAEHDGDPDGTLAARAEKMLNPFRRWG